MTCPGKPVGFLWQVTIVTSNLRRPYFLLSGKRNKVDFFLGKRPRKTWISSTFSSAARWENCAVSTTWTSLSPSQWNSMGKPEHLIYIRQMSKPLNMRNSHFPFFAALLERCSQSSELPELKNTDVFEICHLSQKKKASSSFVISVIWPYIDEGLSLVL